MSSQSGYSPGYSGKNKWQNPCLARELAFLMGRAKREGQVRVWDWVCVCVMVGERVVIATQSIDATACPVAIHPLFVCSFKGYHTQKKWKCNHHLRTPMPIEDEVRFFTLVPFKYFRTLNSWTSWTPIIKVFWAHWNSPGSPSLRWGFIFGYGTLLILLLLEKYLVGNNQFTVPSWFDS